MSYNTTSLGNCLQSDYLFSSIDTLDQCFQQALYGVGNSSAPCIASAASPLVQLFDTCMQNYCQQDLDTELGGCPYTSISTKICSQDGFVDFSMFPTLCGNITASVNADIGGIGVIISYIMQIFIALGASIILSLLGSLLATIHRKWPRTGDTPQDKRSTKHHTDQAAVLKSMLVEFQEAQCFFMLATQIAVLISFRNQSKFYEPKDSAQLDLDNYLGQIIGTGGLLPISLVLFTLHNVGMNSWYILILSGITLATSSATVIISSKNENIGNDNAAFENFYNTAIVDGCGGNRPPIVFCDVLWNIKGTGTQDFVQNVLDWIYIPPLVVFSVILFQLLLSLPQFSRFRKRTLPQLSRLKGSKLVRYLNGLWILVISILYLLAFYSYLANLYYLAKFGGIDTSNWALGQIVAVTIWAPVIFKYIYSAFSFIFGLEEHSKVRFPKPYMITRSNHSNPQIGIETGNIPERESGSEGSYSYKEIPQHGCSKTAIAHIIEAEVEV